MEIWKKMWVGVFFWTQCSDWFYIFYISQGSVVTQLRCGGMFCNHFMTNFPQNAPVKKFDIWLIFDKDMDKTLWLTFFGHPVDSVYRFCMFNTLDEPIGLHITLIALLRTLCTKTAILLSIWTFDSLHVHYNKACTGKITVPNLSCLVQGIDQIIVRNKKRWRAAVKWQTDTTVT